MSAHHLERRSFLSRLGAGATAVGVTLGLSQARATAQTQAVVQPARHAEDDWFDQPAAKHRVFFDTTTVPAFGQAIFYSNNFYTASRSAYQLTDADNALVICVRHQSTALAYDDEMWAKYGGPLSQRAGGFIDPKTKQPPIVNVYRASGYGEALLNNGVTLDAVIRRGLRLAVCQLATRANAGVIAQATGGSVDAIVKELVEHLVPNAHMVPAGIIAVNRAQERGYSFSYVA